MKGLRFSQRFLCFLSVAAPALSAFLLGRLLTNCTIVFRSYYTGGDEAAPLPALTRLLLHLGSNSAMVRSGEFAAITIASLGFILVHRLAPERAFRNVLALSLIAWIVLMTVAMLSLVAFASPLTSR